MDMNREMLNDFWKTIGFEQGTNRVVINYGQYRTYVNDFYLINQNGKYYIHDKLNDKLFDQDLNYYHSGNYYDRKGNIIQDIPNDNIIDIDPDKVYKTKPSNTIEHYDSDGNPYKLTPQEAFDKYGPDDDRFYTSQGLDPVEQREKVNKLNSKRKPIEIEEVKPEEYDNFVKEYEQILDDIEKLRNDKPKYKPVKGPKLKDAVSDNALPKKKLSKATSEAITEAIGNLSTGKKVGLVVAAVGIGAYLLGSNSDKEEKEQNNVHPIPSYQQHVASTAQARYDNTMMYNSYAQQMAKDISSYRYGKHMTGFMN